jgi:hypothetical protein
MGLNGGVARRRKRGGAGREGDLERLTKFNTVAILGNRLSHTVAGTSLFLFIRHSEDRYHHDLQMSLSIKN